MKVLYAIVSWLIVALGAIHMLATFHFFHTLNSAALWFFSGGIALALTGILNLLQRAYGSIAPGLGKVCTGTNITMSIFAAISGVTTHASLVQFAILVGLLVSTIVFSLVPAARQRPATNAASRALRT